ncbi:MAG: metallophosphoesterase [Alphaproteobacteria bacterium]
MRYKHIFISDIHAGDPHNQNIPNCIKFLDSLEAETVYVVGDNLETHLLQHQPHNTKPDDTLAVLAAFERLKTRHLHLLPGNHDSEIEDMVQAGHSYYQPDFTLRCLPDSLQSQFLKPLQALVRGQLSHHVNIDHGKTHVVHGHRVGILPDALWKIGRFLERHCNVPPTYLNPDQIKTRNQIVKATGFHRRLSSSALKHQCTRVIHGHVHDVGLRAVKGTELICLPDWIEGKGGALVERLDGTHAMIDPQHRVTHTFGL